MKNKRHSFTTMTVTYCESNKLFLMHYHHFHSYKNIHAEYLCAVNEGYRAKGPEPWRNNCAADKVLSVEMEYSSILNKSIVYPFSAPNVSVHVSMFT
jgi:hypothetical protein